MTAFFAFLSSTQASHTSYLIARLSEELEIHAVQCHVLVQLLHSYDAVTKRATKDLIFVPGPPGMPYLSKMPFSDSHKKGPLLYPNVKLDRS